MLYRYRSSLQYMYVAVFMKFTFRVTNYCSDAGEERTTAIHHHNLNKHTHPPCYESRYYGTEGDQTNTLEIQITLITLAILLLQF